MLAFGSSDGQAELGRARINVPRAAVAERVTRRVRAGELLAGHWSTR